MTDVLPPADNEYGERVRARLSGEIAVWLTTVGADGTPQPNPVWFVWDGGTSLLVYNRSDAHRLTHLRRSPRLSLHFDGNGRGGNVVVLTGSARVIEAPAPHEHPDYVSKYRADMARVSGSPEQFSAQYPVALQVTIDKIRGF
ncbi:MAG TPA: TIGR03667 family PPOX class F420-dependent oxidoreductase [Jatrophihabitantaceae bacterium]|nr:TIGR03667 family PPOX class F420-dependent oxidoreductase [Jatrophihabitantaceae bacterium]